MICEACHGQQTFPPCPECGGCGIAHCCDGLVECPIIGNFANTHRPETLIRKNTEQKKLGSSQIPN